MKDVPKNVIDMVLKNETHKDSISHFRQNVREEQAAAADPAFDSLAGQAPPDSSQRQPLDEALQDVGWDPNQDADDDFIDEDGHFVAKLKLYDDEQGKCAPAYSGLAGEVVRTIDPETEADPVATLITFLTAYGNVIGDRAHFTAAATSHPMRLFSVLVGATGSGKGMSLSPIKYLFKAIDHGWATDKIASGLSSGEGLIEAVRDPQFKKVPKYEGKGKDKKIVGYEEELIDEGVEDKRLFAIEEEFGKVLKVANREGNILSPIIRQLWDSGSPRIMTKNPVKTTGAHISMLGHITLEELKTEMNDVDAYNGFTNRFLWLVVKRSKLLPSGGRFMELDLEPLVDKIHDAVEFGKSVDNIKRDQEAERIWKGVYEPLSSGRGIVGSVTARAVPQVMRLASIYALLDCSSIITTAHLKAALSLWGYCYQSARYIFGDGRILENSKAQRLLDELKNRKDGMTKTEVSNFFSRHLSSKEIKSLVNELTINGYVRIEKERSGKGRPSQKIVSID